MVILSIASVLALVAFILALIEAVRVRVSLLPWSVVLLALAMLSSSFARWPR